MCALRECTTEPADHRTGGRRDTPSRRCRALVCFGYSPETPQCKQTPLGAPAPFNDMATGGGSSILTSGPSEHGALSLLELDKSSSTLSVPALVPTPFQAPGSPTPINSDVPFAKYDDMGLPNPAYYRDGFDDEIDRLEQEQADRAVENAAIEERAALAERKIKDLRGQQAKVHRDVERAEEATLAVVETLDQLHGDESRLVKAAVDCGLTGDRDVDSRFAQDELAHELRNLAAMMDVPDWLKEEDLALQLKQEAVACKTKTRDLLQKAKERGEEAKQAAVLIEETTDQTVVNAGAAVDRITKRFSILREALNQRENELVQAVDRSRKEKLLALQTQLAETTTNVTDIEAAVGLGEAAMDMDDMAYLDAYLHRLDNKLETASTTFTSMETYAQPDFPLSFGHRSLRSDIANHGTVGSLELLAGGPRGHGILMWDHSRTEDKLEIVMNGRGVKHVGPEAGKSTSISELGFGGGRNIWQMEMSGLRNGQWISVGVCTAALINSNRYAQDAVIFQVSIPMSPGEGTSGTAQTKQLGANSKFEVNNTDTIMVVLDCEGAVVEYYKNKTCIKTAMLMVFERENDADGGTEVVRGEAGSQQKGGDEHDDDLTLAETIWYPFATLYQMDQVIAFK